MMIVGDAVTLTSNNDRHCLSQTSRIKCTHPFNDGSLVILWERNGTRLNRFVHSLSEIEPTYIAVPLFYFAAAGSTVFWVIGKEAGY